MFVELAVVLKKLVVVPAVRESVPAVRAPRLALVEKRLVELAVVENKLVVVPAVIERLRSVVSPVFEIENKDEVALAVEEAISNRREFVSPLFA